jgi:ABC-2 type transport system permease protein
MKLFWAALWAETLKVRRSKIFMVIILAFIFIAIMMGLLMYVARHPEMAGNAEVIRTKVSVIGNGDWPSYLRLLVLSILTMGSMGYGIITAWVFGREYSDRVFKDLLALPVSRLTIVGSKFFVIFLWSLILTLVFYTTGLFTGLAVNLDGWSGSLAWQSFLLFSRGSILTLLLCTPVAFIACFSRGFLLPVGFILLTLILTQLVFLGILGITSYFPWAIPALYCGAAGPDIPHPTVISLIILIATSLTGILCTAAWWKYADHT